jgi:hypothetical protein
VWEGTKRMWEGTNVETKILVFPMKQK